MNFEHLCKFIAHNNYRIADVEKTRIFLKNQYRHSKIRKSKLKLGAIIFEFINLTFADLILSQTVDIRYIRQDNTDEDELKLENRLKALNWKWDFSNVGAFLIIFIFCALFVHSYLYLWYHENLPSIAVREPKYEKLIKFTIEAMFSINLIESLKSFNYLNIFLVDALVRLVLFFDVFF